MSHVMREEFPELSDALGAMTEPTPEETAHWRAALERCRDEARVDRKRPVVRPWMGAALAASVVIVGAAVTVLPRVEGERRYALSEKGTAARMAGGMQGMRGFADGSGGSGGGSVLQGFNGFIVEGLADSDQSGRVLEWITDGSTAESASTMLGVDDPAFMGRSVARDASVALIVEDVRAAFDAAARLARALDGEFVENSGMNGEGEHARATVRLRVMSDRLDHVMAEARALGEVSAEQSDAKDVTDALVDLEARVRNEQRIEAELLDLLASRNDAPLADILKVRESLAQVRLRIEQIKAQQASLKQRVSLSTLTITMSVKPEESAAEPEPGYLSSRMSEAWTGAGRMLADSAAWLVRVVLGGAVFWVIAAAVGAIVWRWMRRRAVWAG